MEKIMFSRDDFGICRAAIIHSISYWREAVNDSDLRPDGWRSKDCENILTNLNVVLDKLEKVLLLDENIVSKEFWDNLQKEISNEQGKID